MLDPGSIPGVSIIELANTYIMANTCKSTFSTSKEEIKMSGNEEQKDDVYINQLDDEFDFVDAFDDQDSSTGDDLLPDNTAVSALDVAFLGIGGGGGKLAKAFIDAGFSRSLLVNTTIKDQPEGVDEKNFLLLPGADGVGKDIDLGKKILSENSALVEDAIRARLGKPDWIFVLAGGGGGTGSSCSVLHDALTRHLTSTGASGRVVYVLSKPGSQEMLNSTIARNFNQALDDISDYPHIVIDNEKQLELLRNKVGMLNLYPVANKMFAKLLSQVFKLAATHSDIQTFDSKDLESCLKHEGRIVVGSTVIRDTSRKDLGAAVLTGCIKSSPCPTPATRLRSGALLMVASSAMVGDPTVSKNLEAAFSYVGGRTDTMFSGVYVKENAPGLIALCLLAE